ncbi:MAG: NosD domain-containing protein [Candidatus Thorarchaeota archaeon]
MKGSLIAGIALYGAFIFSLLIVGNIIEIHGKTSLEGPHSAYFDNMSPSFHSPLQSYLPHAPIYVTNDTELAAVAVNPSSTGAADDPYILEGWNLSSIVIIDTTKYFIIRNCWLDGLTWSAIGISNVGNGTCTIKDNIMQNYGPGVSLSGIEFATITNNTCHNMRIVDCSFVTITFNNCSGGRGIELETCANMSISNNFCSGNPQGYYGGIVLDGVLSSTVFNNTFCNNSVGITVDGSSYCRFLNNSCYMNEGAGISVFGDSRWNVIEGNLCYLNYWGIRDYSNRYSTISTNDVHHNSHSGILCESSPDAIILHNRCYKNGIHGINVRESARAQLGGNNCTQNTDRGIYVDDCPNSTISYNICDQNPIGVSIDHGSSYAVVKNRLRGNWDGFLFQNALYLIIKNNTVHLSENTVLRMANAHFSLLEWNLFVENAKRLALDAQCSDNKIHHNVFIKNQPGMIQALDNGSNNQWYDPDTEEGNYWSDYAGEGNYSIAGAAGKADIYPFNLSAIFSVSHFDNMTFEEGTTGHQITWTVVSIFHTHYEIYLNGKLVEQDIWNGSLIVHSADDLDPGVHNITIVIHMLGASESDTVFITVEKVTSKKEDEDSGFSPTFLIPTILLGFSIAALWRKQRKR